MTYWEELAWYAAAWARQIDEAFMADLFAEDGDTA
jgi:hypothetical protein